MPTNFTVFETANRWESRSSLFRSRFCTSFPLSFPPTFSTYSRPPRCFCEAIGCRDPIKLQPRASASESRSAPGRDFPCSMSSDATAELELELGELLQEFQDVVEELKAPSQSKPHAYQHVLQDAKSRAGLGDDSGVDDSDYSSEASLGNSLNTSEEELHTAGIKLAPKAKLGDTRELDIFIDMLDRELAEM